VVEPIDTNWNCSAIGFERGSGFRVAEPAVSDKPDAQAKEIPLVTGLRPVTHCPRGSASFPGGGAGKTVRSQAEPGNELSENVYSSCWETCPTVVAQCKLKPVVKPALSP